MYLFNVWYTTYERPFKVEENFFSVVKYSKSYYLLCIKVWLE